MANPLGSGISIATGGQRVNADSLMSGNPKVAIKTLDSNGKTSITISSASTKYGIAGLQAGTGAQSGISRINPSNTSAIEFEADIQSEAQGIQAAIIYWE